MQHRLVLLLAVGGSALFAFVNYYLYTVVVGPSSSGKTGISSASTLGCSLSTCDNRVMLKTETMDSTGNLSVRGDPTKRTVRIDIQTPTNATPASHATRLATTTAPRLSLHLIGERHSGTKWISGQLQKCFRGVLFSNKFFRWKHWF